MMNKDYRTASRRGIVAGALALCIVLLALPSVLAAASFQVTQIACPSGAKVSSSFSCTVTIRNGGDAPGNIGTVVLYPNADNWLEQSSHVKTVNSQNVSVGDSVEVTFPGMKATKGGQGRFSEVRIDEASDTSSTVTGYSMNIIDVSVIVTSTAASGGTYSNFSTTAEVIASGDVLVTLSLGVDSGGCSLGDYEAQKTLDMSHNSRQAHTWTVRMGTSGDCRYTVTASATEKGTVALVTDNMQTTVTCTDCPVDSGSSGSSGGGGGGGGGGGAATAAKELVGSATYTLGVDEKTSFLLDGESHSVTVKKISATSIEVEVRSVPQTVTLLLGQEKHVDVNGDAVADLALKVENINIMTKKVTLVLTSLVVPKKKGAAEGAAGSASATAGSADDTAGTTTSGTPESVKKGISFIVIVLIVAGLFVAIMYGAWRHSPEQKLRRVAQRVSWHPNKGLAEPWVDAAKKKKFVIFVGAGIVALILLL